MPNISALFLDRDGVINKKLEGDYVKNREEFEFLPHAVEAVKLLNEKNIPVYLISNQSGIGRGLMTLNDLEAVHKKMLDEMKKSGAFISDIFVCPHAPEDNCDCRKPKPGLLLRAKAKYPSINFKNSWFIGDSVSDMKAAEAAGCKPYLLKNGENLKIAVEGIINEK